MDEKKKGKMQELDKIIIFVAIGIVVFSVLIGTLIHEIKWRKEWTKDLSNVTIEFTHEDAPESLVVNLGKISDKDNPTLICYNDEWANADFFDLIDGYDAPKVKIKVGAKTLKKEHLPKGAYDGGYIRRIQAKEVERGMSIRYRIYKSKNSDSGIYVKEIIVRIRIVETRLKR